MKLKDLKKEYYDSCMYFKNVFVCKLYLYLNSLTSLINLKILGKIIFSPLNISHKRLNELYGDNNLLANQKTFFISKTPNSSNKFHSIFTIIKNEDNSFRLLNCLEYMHAKFLNEETDFQLAKEQLKIFKYSNWIDIGSELHDTFGFDSKTGSLKKKFYHKIKF